MPEAEHQPEIHIHCSNPWLTIPFGMLCRRGTAFHLLRLCGGAPQPGLLDLARATIQPAHMLLPFNPFLSDASCARLKEASLFWGELCVLEDRLCRIAVLAAASRDFQPMLIRVGT